ncbi:MAG: ABC transporter ATP-binding protein [Gemmataceae bacterium]|nr:ABC transporter ATP-binding protein [Gemmataceae bacterium]MCI0738732.1 ABC transporter ATP-binding protein [Gemmataceae bacterium]
MAAIRLDKVSKTYPNGVQALKDIELEAAAGEWLALVGPSGCGKTTTLRVISGLESPSSGLVRIAGKDVTQLEPWKRDVSMVFQRPALFPTKSVRQNLLFGLSTPFAEGRAVEIARLLKIADLLDRYPAELSGGQQQRVALGRALVRNASICLLDEPFGQLDAPLRREFSKDLPLLRSRFPATIIIVTHDPAEALTLGDRVAVLRDGVLVQVDTPEQLRHQPRDTFVTEFLAR